VKAKGEGAPESWTFSRRMPELSKARRPSLRWNPYVMSYERSCVWDKLNSWRTTSMVERLV